LNKKILNLHKHKLFSLKLMKNRSTDSRAVESLDYYYISDNNNNEENERDPSHTSST